MSAIDQERIAGAKECLDVLRRLDQLLKLGTDRSIGPARAKRDAVISAILATAGELSPRATGVLTLLAEVIVTEKQDGTYFEDFEDYEPEATMTPNQVLKSREAIRTEELAEELSEANVIQFPPAADWRATS